MFGASILVLLLPSRVSRLAVLIPTSFRTTHILVFVVIRCRYGLFYTYYTYLYTYTYTYIRIYSLIRILYLYCTIIRTRLLYIFYTWYKDVCIWIQVFLPILVYILLCVLVVLLLWWLIHLITRSAFDLFTWGSIFYCILFILVL